ncbi:MAG: RNase P modulator RnpM [Bacillota bacterium]
MSRKRIPLRRCVGCGERKEKMSMIRIVRTPQGELEVDKKGKMPGRGCYVCPEEECIIAALSKDRLARSLRIGEIDEQTRECLRAKIDDAIDTKPGEVRR